MVIEQKSIIARRDVEELKTLRSSGELKRFEVLRKQMKEETKNVEK